MKRLVILCFAALLGITAAPTFAGEQETTAVSPRTAESRAIEFEAIDRTIAKQPALVSLEPRYALLLFGVNGESKMWAILDKSDAGAKAFDRLYLDLNANGDLTEPGELFTAQPSAGESVMFSIAKLIDPATKAVHTDFTLLWSPKTEKRAESNRFRMKWRGDKITMGPYGPYRETYQSFGKSPQQAPVFIPGYDRPFEFQHWASDKLVRGRSHGFKVFVGNRGSRTGAFFCVDDEFLKIADSPQATLIFTDVRGKEQRYQIKLSERC